MPSRSDSFNFHIHNGGINISVCDITGEGTSLVISAEHFGIKTNEIVLPISNNKLRMLSEFFKDQSTIPCVSESSQHKHWLTGHPWFGAYQSDEDDSVEVDVEREEFVDNEKHDLTDEELCIIAYAMSDEDESTEEEVADNIRKGQEALERAATALCTPGVLIKEEKDIPLYYADPSDPDFIIQILNGEETKGQMVNGVFVGEENGN